MNLQSCSNIDVTFQNQWIFRAAAISLSHYRTNESSELQQYRCHIPEPMNLQSCSNIDVTFQNHRIFRAAAISLSHSRTNESSELQQYRCANLKSRLLNLLRLRYSKSFNFIFRGDYISWRSLLLLPTFTYICTYYQCRHIHDKSLWCRVLEKTAILPIHTILCIFVEPTVS